MNKILTYPLLLGLILLIGCSPAKQVTRVDTDTTIDLSGRWNDTDSRMVADGIIGECLSHPWITDHMVDASAKPVVIVGGIRNKSMEHIAVQTFISDIERAFINSGKVRTVSSAGERGELRAERADPGRVRRHRNHQTDGKRTRCRLHDDRRNQHHRRPGGGRPGHVLSDRFDADEH